MNLTKEERLKKIIDLLSKNKKLSTKKLQQLMEVSISTLRRDLITLENTNSIQHTHGYVSLLENSNVEFTYAIRRDKNEAIKKKLCKQAAQIITDGSAIFLDGSSTLAFLPKYFSGKSNIHVITNNIHIASEINQLKGIDLSVIGGEVAYRSNSIVGPRALEDLKTNYRPNISFLSCNSLDENGIYMSDENQTLLKRTAIKVSNQTVLLVDHSKFTKNDYILLCDYNIKNIQTIITDQLPSEKITENIQSNGINLIVTK